MEKCVVAFVEQETLLLPDPARAALLPSCWARLALIVALTLREHRRVPVTIAVPLASSTNACGS